MDAASERASLLERHKPALRYDSQEVYFADSAAEWTDNPGNELIRATGEVVAIAGAAPPQTALSLDLLGSYSDPEPADAIADPRRDYQAQYAAQHSQADARPWSKVDRDPGSTAGSARPLEALPGDGERGERGRRRTDGAGDRLTPRGARS